MSALLYNLSFLGTQLHTWWSLCGIASVFFAVLVAAAVWLHACLHHPRENPRWRALGAALAVLGFCIALTGSFLLYLIVHTAAV
ncbi:MAG TPA: hypothetical protein H9985_08475 [Candidatus Anaerofilum faecale]|nr:hypothetical protein [Candidatus Anaerofilum faecale]